MKYELVLMLKPSLTEEQVKSAVSGMSAKIKELGGAVEREDLWGKKKLAYEIKRLTEAYYAVLNIELPPSEIKKLSSKIATEDNILRQQIISTKG